MRNSIQLKINACGGEVCQNILKTFAQRRCRVKATFPSKLAGRRKCSGKLRQEKLQPSEAKCRDGGGFTETESGEAPQARNELQLQQ